MSMTAIGSSKSSVAAARNRMLRGLRRSPLMYAVVPSAVLSSRMSACARTSGSLSTYTTRASDVASLGDAVHVVIAGYAGADVDELAHADLVHQVAHGPPQELAVGPGVGPQHVQAAGGQGHLVAELAVDGEVLVAAEDVVVYPGRMGDAGVDSRGWIVRIDGVRNLGHRSSVGDAACGIPTSSSRSAHLIRVKQRGSGPRRHRVTSTALHAGRVAVGG